MDLSEAEKDYFVNYEELEVHRLMLEDIPRTEAYRKAIFENEVYFKDKVVMDVGCGTGILSLFCAQAGAKKVYAVEASNLANVAEEVVLENNFKHVIEVLHSRVEDVKLPDGIKVDIIISEWMGFYLLHEGMLNSVLEARDKFLKEGGEMFPDFATIHVAPCSLPTYNEKWVKFCGVSLNSFAKHLREAKTKPEIMQVCPDDLLAPSKVVAALDLKKVKISDVDEFSTEHVVGASRNGNFQGVCIWFECTFPQLTDKDQVTLSTEPSCALTHWKQTVIFLPESIEVEKEEPIAYKLDMVRDSESHRRYKLELTLLDPTDVEHPMGCSCYQTKCILVRAVMAEQSVLMDEDIVSDDEGSD
ncbi:protein arginine N-methyltransferase 1 [Aricia agestis]|uniref:protein arginine N-methyltransferase 1 n=1 Tax=Aricia agestis TaxID=91739 RepID=UPI001C20A3FD|nr:protein arginine N-methyltransferase 1 [Aricia agestis]